MKLTKATIATADNGTTIMLSPAVLMAVRHMLTVYSESGGPAFDTAIKFVRLSCGIDLKTAKDVVDALREAPEFMD